MKNLAAGENKGPICFKNLFMFAGANIQCNSQNGVPPDVVAQLGISYRSRVSKSKAYDNNNSPIVIWI